MASTAAHGTISPPLLFSLHRHIFTAATDPTLGVCVRVCALCVRVYMRVTTSVPVGMYAHMYEDVETDTGSSSGGVTEYAVPGCWD